MSNYLSARYYLKNKERLHKKACGKYHDLSEEKKQKARIWPQTI